jgi:hypothetical protein
MSELDVIAYPRDVMHLSQVTSGDRWWSADDVRNDGRVKDALTVLDLFRGGISVSLDSVRIPENAAISTVEYVFTIANKDRGSLYVFDPDKLDTRLFHWFTIGVVFRGSAGVFWSMHKEVLQPTTDWDPAWFCEVPVDSTIQRTVRLKGYPRIPPGHYTCYFEFFNPPVERENRVMPRGRVWVGSIYSTKLDLEVN